MIGESLSVLLWPVLGVTALGVLLVCLGGFLLGNYLSRPVEELEEGLLAILNGKTDLRFEIEHAELGGLVFRLNSLLNQLMGVQEDDTDEEGRPSRPPKASDFQDALAVDERSVAGGQRRRGPGGHAPGRAGRLLLRASLSRVHRRQAIARRIRPSTSPKRPSWGAFAPARAR